MGEDDFDFDARMMQLARAFLDALPDKYEQLVQQWQLWNTKQDPAAVEQIQLIVHRLSGSSDNYGYEALGRSARALDALLRHQVSPQSIEKPLAELLAAINAILGRSAAIQRPSAQSSGKRTGLC